MECEPRLLSWYKSQPEKGAPVVLPRNEAIVLPTGKIGAFSAEECKRVLEVTGQYRFGQALTGDGGDKVRSDKRTTLVKTFVSNSETAFIFERLESVLSTVLSHFQFEVTGFFEGIQLYSYPTGGFLDWHMDIGKGIMSNRKLAISVQLSDDHEYDGGDMEFEDSEGAAPRALGTVIIFPTYMRHRVTPVTRGARLSLVSWIHGPPFR